MKLLTVDDLLTMDECDLRNLYERVAYAHHLRFGCSDAVHLVMGGCPFARAAWS
ncbi:MAG: hypothetical protein KGK07_13455 [Chloroflexota bacterium]|nr:hypothetical protein [Chloroflexota bacterium]